MNDLALTMQKFYKLEDYRVGERFLTDEEQYCEQHFEQTHKRAPDGRFIAEIPLKENHKQLVNNRGRTLVQFLSYEKKIQKDPAALKASNDFMQVYADLGHMHEIDEKKEIKDVVPFYLPRHTVHKPDSTTTATREVFNASSKTASGLSLNDVQCVGPSIQVDAFSLLLKFRTYAVVIKADIAKMYRQIDIIPWQRPLQRIFWRKTPSDPLKVYELKTVTYGTASASFIATRCIKQLAIEHRDVYPEAAKEVEESIYMDDVITGASNVEHAIELTRQIDQIIANGAMKLRKFSSNSQELINSIPEEDREPASEDASIIKALGVRWHPNRDTIRFEFKHADRKKITKRSVLSDIAKFYDPEGFMGPVTFKKKCFLKIVWNHNVAWDDQLPQEIVKPWLELSETISTLNDIEIPRHAIISNPIDLQLHIFVDASDKGYGSCCYIRSEDAHGNCVMNLICAKSRIAPNERRSTARLELCGAVIGANLKDRIINALPLTFSKRFCWTDSAIVLHWIKKHPQQLQPFVANRVSEIQELSHDVVWRHVRGEENPADLISRGLMPTELVSNDKWFHGPPFLQLPEDEWPESIVEIDPEDANYTGEFKRAHTTVTLAQQNENSIMTIVENCSRLYAAKIKIAWIARFVVNTRQKRDKKPLRLSSKLHVADLIEAEFFIARIYQSSNFKTEIESLISSGSVSRQSSLKNLDPYWDAKTKLMRVGGRLRHAQHISEDHKHPIIIPQGHLARLIIRQTHEQAMHSGEKATLGHILQRYWPVKARSAIKAELHKCITCFRARPKIANPFMGQLPPIASSYQELQGRNQRQRWTTRIGAIGQLSASTLVTRKNHLRRSWSRRTYSSRNRAHR